MTGLCAPSPFVDAKPSEPTEAEAWAIEQHRQNGQAFNELYINVVIRGRDWCESCAGEGFRQSGHEEIRCATCDGWGYIDETDASLRARVLAAARK